MNDRATARRRTRTPGAPATLLASACEGLPVGFALFDRGWLLVSSNDRFAALRGYPRKLLKTGTPLESFVRFDVERGEYGAGAADALTRKRLAALKRGRPAERDQARRDGRIVRVACERLPEGGLLLTCEDVTDAHRTAERLRESEQRYDFAMRAMNEGVYDWDIAGGTIYYSDRVRAVLGLSPKELRTPAAFLERVHPDDRPQFRAATVAHFKGETERFECDYRFRARDGSWRWARQHGVALRDARGRAVRMIGSTGDVTELKERERQLAEQTAEQTAVRELLEAMSRSAFDLDGVLRALVEKATRLCGAEKGFIFRLDRDAYRLGVDYGGVTPEFREYEARHPMRPGRETLIGRTALEKRVVHIEDILADREYGLPEAQRIGGFRTILGVPIVRDDVVVGVLALWKERVEPFTPAQIQLVTTFSNQASIAIENARLFAETKEALERQTATADILRVISSSPTDVQPVFDAIARSGVHLFRGFSISIRLLKGDRLERVAFAVGPGADVVEDSLNLPLPFNDRTFAGRAVLRREVVHAADVIAENWTAAETRKLAEREGWRACAAAPMLRDGHALGAIVVSRASPTPFGEKEVALLQTFADQAVIAIENVRLFNETKEALEHQTATAEILKVISSSPTDVRPVFDAIVQSGVRLFQGLSVSLRLVNGDRIERVAFAAGPGSGVSEDERPDLPLPLDDRTVAGRAILRRQVVHVPDVSTEDWIGEASRSVAERMRYRAIVAAPLVREGRALGVIGVTRARPAPFDAKEIALLRTFADQAVIAIENVRLFNELEARNRDLTEALEQQTATTEILRVISSSPTDIQPVLDAVASTASRLCEASDVLIFQVDGNVLRQTASHGLMPAMLADETMPVDRGSVTGRCVVDRQSIHVADLATADEAEFPVGRAYQRRWGHHTALSTPLLREGKAIGAIGIRRLEVRPFSDQQVRLLEIFAHQAVIAIENVRLFNELAARNRELTESLEQQTATAEILRVISESPRDLKPVFDAILDRATSLCEAQLGVLFQFDGERYHIVATRGGEPAAITRWKEEFSAIGPPGPRSGLGRLLTDKRPVHIPDILEEAAYHEGDVLRLQTANLLKARTFLAVPLLKDGMVVGAAVIYRREVRPFTDKQVALVRTFADQAVIAVENVRLFNELEARNRELTESLEQQTATAEILRVISGSPTDIAPVLDAVAENATRLCEAQDVVIMMNDGSVLRAVKSSGLFGERFGTDFTIPVTRGSAAGRAFLERATVRVANFALESDEEYPVGKEHERVYGNHGAMATPLLRGDEALGVIAVLRRDVRPFSDRQGVLLQTFADQAAIAIANVRLFSETKEALDQQKASAEVLQVISSSVADTAPVFEKILESCERLFEGRTVGINLVGADGAAHLTAYHGPYADALHRHFPVPLSEESGSGAAILQRRVIHYPDVEAPEVPDYARRGSLLIGNRSVLFAPMLWEGRAIGAIFVGRPFVGEFSEKEIALLRTFADQAVIAIQNARLFNQTKEALERQTATAEILRVISSSPTDIQPVLDSVAERAGVLCEAPYANVMLVEGDQLRVMSAYSTEPGPRPDRRNFVPLRRSYVNARAVLDREIVHIPDIVPLIDTEFPDIRGNQAKFGFRAVLVVPLMRERKAIGTIFLWRRDPGAFSDDQVALVRTFADQAVIAIENVRLFNETRETLERQTATAEILRVIANSPSDVQPVFDAIIHSAARLVPGTSINVSRLVGDHLHLAAYTPVSPSADETLRNAFPVAVTEVGPLGEAIRTRSPCFVGDFETDPQVGRKARELMRVRAFRSTLYVPIVHGEVVHGVVHVNKVERGPFPERWIELLKTFADQAAIAIENVRLFNETKEALEKQTAISEILRVISASPTDLQPVFDTIVRSAVKLCGSANGALFRYDGERLHFAAGDNATPQLLDAVRSEYPMRPQMSTVAGRAVLTQSLVHIDDVLADSEYDHARALRGGWRRMLAVPMRRDGPPLGVIVVSWTQPGRTPKAQEDLLRTFADQAAIAIENVRLFNETKEALDQLKASAEVLQVISSSVADTQPVFDKILESCQRLFEGRNVGITLVGDDGAVHLGPYRGFDRRELEGMYPLPLSRASGSGSAILERRVMHYPDVERGDGVPEPVRHGSRVIGLKSIVFAPMLWEGRGIGAIFVGRATPGEFSDKEIALLKTFADQAVIAIQNARLFSEIREKSQQLEIANQHKSAFLANMSHELRTPLNAVIGFSEMLNARYFGDLTEKQAEYVGDIHTSGKHLLSLINDILDLSKIEAGRMELEPSEFDLRAALDNALTLVRERAQRSGIAVRLETDPALGALHGDERKVKQVVLNLLSNAVKFTPRGGVVDVVARKANGSAEIAVSDTGVGIAPADQEAIFEAFRQVGTDATRKREGTGLGLALSRRFVELHGGTIRVESEPGKGSTFTVTLPLRHGE